MSQFKLLQPSDTNARDEIIGASDAELARVSQNPESSLGEWAYDALVDRTLVFGGHCEHVSDAVTYAALQLGICASRQFSAVGHFYTSFADPGKPPSAHDLILCRTWGQFLPAHKQYRDPIPAAFFGTRGDLEHQLSEEHYPIYLGAYAVTLTQTAYREATKSWLDSGRDWLTSSPLQQAGRTLPMGELPPDAQTNGRIWEKDIHPALLAMSRAQIVSLTSLLDYAE